MISRMTLAGLQEGSPEDISTHSKGLSSLTGFSEEQIIEKSMQDHF